MAAGTLSHCRSVHAASLYASRFDCKAEEDQQFRYCNAAHFAETEKAADCADEFTACFLEPF